MRGVQPLDSNTAIFLLVDAQVLQDPQLRLLKAVDADHNPITNVPRNTRVRQLHCGWIVISTTAVAGIFYRMNAFTFDEIVGHANGGPGAFWNPGEHLRWTTST